MQFRYSVLGGRFDNPSRPGAGDGNHQDCAGEGELGRSTPDSVWKSQDQTQTDSYCPSLAGGCPPPAKQRAAGPDYEQTNENDAGPEERVRDSDDQHDDDAEPPEEAFGPFNHQSESSGRVSPNNGLVRRRSVSTADIAAFRPPL